MVIFSVHPLLAAMAAAVTISATSAAADLTPEQQADVTRPPNRVTAQDCCGVYELRQYTLHPGKRDVLIDLFEREFIDGQEAVGMHIVGQFHDLDDPDRFVWIRGFADMESRRHALNAFYYGPVWQAHRNTANAALVDNDNVLLLRSAGPHSAFRIETEAADASPSSRVLVATIYSGKAPLEQAFTREFETFIMPLLIETGARPIAWFENETTENTFPRLPVRQGENVFVWLAMFNDDAVYQHHLAALRHSTQWNNDIVPMLEHLLKTPAQQLRLRPAAKSRLGGK